MVVVTGTGLLELERGSRLHNFLILIVKFCCYSYYLCLCLCLCCCHVCLILIVSYWDYDCGGLFDSCSVLAMATLGSFSNCV